MTETAQYKRYADVSMGMGLKQLFTYGVPDHLLDQVSRGKRVVVELGNRQRVGVVMSVVSSCKLATVKEVISVLDAMPVLSPKMLKLVEWVAAYYLAPLGAVVQATVPTAFAKGKALQAITGGRPKRKSNRTPIDIVASFPVDLGIEGSGVETDFGLFSQQQEALTRIVSAVDAKEAKPILLHGVTGSGKTEVYLQATDYVLKKGKSALILVPEISLTPALLALFIRRFGERAGILHSRLTPAQRRQQWERAQRGEVDVVIGVRSAVFAPLKRLGLIVVDEEHEGTYKQETAPFFNARDVAVVRASIFKCPVVLCGATPSLETFHNASKGKYDYIFLKERVDSRPMADVTVVDMRQKSAEDTSVLSPLAHEAIERALAADEQALLFLNRRGFSPFLSCPVCGHVFRCEHCDIAMTYHSCTGDLLCHLCGAARPLPSICDICRYDKLRLMGFGTEKVEEEAERLFPGARVMRMDSDAISTRRKYEQALASIYKREVDIIVGTQIVAKGHNFPHLTLAVVVLADTILSLPDFRAAERTFQLLTQVSGRPGRHGKRGAVILQTFSPDHYAIRAAAAQDSLSFFEAEMEFRRKLGLPPLTRLSSILVSGKNYEKAAKAAERLGEMLRANRPEDIHVLGPAEAPIAKLRDRFRFQAFVRSYSSNRLRSFLTHKRKEINAAKLQSGDLRITFDVDPGSML